MRKSKTYLKAAREAKGLLEAVACEAASRGIAFEQIPCGPDTLGSLKFGDGSEISAITVMGMMPDLAVWDARTGAGGGVQEILNRNAGR